MTTQSGAFAPHRVETSIPARFERLVAKQPDHSAIHSAGSAMTYGELNAAANRVTHALRARGIGPGQVVAILADQGPMLVTAQLGILKAGAAFVPLDPTYPEQRNAYMIGDTRAKVLVTHAKHHALADALTSPGVAVLDMDALDPALPETNPEVAIDPGALAYVLYTSGSTGRPKGVMQPHRCVLHNTERHRVYFRLTPDDRQSLVYPCSVYGGTRDIFNALLSGASLHHYPLPVLGHAGLAPWLREQRVTIFCSVVTVFRHFARGLVGQDTLPDIRLVKLGGEAPFVSDIDAFKAHFSRGCTLFCGLGSTEAGMARQYPIDHDTPHEGPGVPLGYAVDGLDVLLLDEQRRPVPTGEVGEITLRSRYITTGYFGRDDLNATAFGTTQDDAARVFYTGDLGVMDKQGLLTHKGRKDRQVKINGNRVELMEVEAAVSDHPAVREVLVDARPDDRGSQQLVAYIVFSAGDRPGVAAIRDFLRPRLPRFAMPGIYVPLETLPQTPNGKADRRALPDPSGRALRPGTPYLEPQTQTQRAVCALYEQVLGVTQPGVLDNFFDLGGDSLSAVELLLCLEQQLGDAPPLAVFFTQPTPRAVANELVGDAQSIDPDTASMLRLNGDHGGPPLFAFAGKGGSVMCMRPLAERLDRWDVYGVQYPGVGDGNPPHEDIAALTQVMARRARKAQPNGPYHLMGYSFGGLIAYETARQLSAQGETIASLTLLDTLAPGALQQKSRLKRAHIHLRRTLATGGWRYPWQQLTRPKPTSPRLNDIVGHDPPHNAEEGEATARFYAALSEHARACERATKNYRPGPYDGPITLIQSQDKPDWHDFVQIPADYGWSNFCSQPVRIHNTSGHHLELFEHPHVIALAQTISQHALTGK